MLTPGTASRGTVRAVVRSVFRRSAVAPGRIVSTPRRSGRHHWHSQFRNRALHGPMARARRGTTAAIAGCAGKRRQPHHTRPPRKRTETTALLHRRTRNRPCRGSAASGRSARWAGAINPNGKRASRSPREVRKVDAPGRLRVWRRIPRGHSPHLLPKGPMNTANGNSRLRVRHSKRGETGAARQSLGANTSARNGPRPAHLFLGMPVAVAASVEEHHIGAASRSARRAGKRRTVGGALRAIRARAAGVLS